MILSAPFLYVYTKAVELEVVSLCVCMYVCLMLLQDYLVALQHDDPNDCRL